MKKKSLLKTARLTSGIIFLFSTSIIATFIFLFFLPTHNTHELQEEHQAITTSVLPFTNTDLSFLTASEENHMHDVSRLGLFFLTTSILSGLFCFRYGFHKVLRASGFFLITIFFLSILFFRQFWNLFHYVFFPQGNWQFPQNSILITLYPQEYFFGATLIFLGLYCLLLMLIFKVEKLQEELNKSRAKKINI